MMWTLYSHSFDSVPTLELKEESGGGGAKLGARRLLHATCTYAVTCVVSLLHSVTFGSCKFERVEASVGGFFPRFFFFFLFLLEDEGGF